MTLRYWECGPGPVPEYGTVCMLIVKNMYMPVASVLVGRDELHALHQLLATTLSLNGQVMEAVQMLPATDMDGQSQ